MPTKHSSRRRSRSRSHSTRRSSKRHREHRRHHREDSSSSNSTSSQKDKYGKRSETKPRRSSTDKIKCNEPHPQKKEQGHRNHDRESREIKKRDRNEMGRFTKRGEGETGTSLNHNFSLNLDARQKSLENLKHHHKT